MALRLSGPSYGPQTEERPSSLVVLLHGFGASGDDLIALAYSWAAQLPQTLFVSPHAPFLCDKNPLGRQWTGLQDLDPQRLWHEMGTLVPLLDVFLSGLLQTHQLTWSNVALAGFSQGAALALHAALYHFPVAGIVSYSGVFIPDPQKTTPKKTPTLLVHGDKDEVLSVNFYKEAKKELSDFDVPLDFMVCDGLGHGISPAGLEKGAQFFKKNLKQATPFPK